jgi:hypothetical protein
LTQAYLNAIYILALDQFCPPHSNRKGSRDVTMTKDEARATAERISGEKGFVDDRRQEFLNYTDRLYAEVELQKSPEPDEVWDPDPEMNIALDDWMSIVWGRTRVVH